jgi:hypothetical protein
MWLNALFLARFAACLVGLFLPLLSLLNILPMPLLLYLQAV